VQPAIRRGYRSAIFTNIDVTGTGTKSKEVVTLVCSDVCTDIMARGTKLVGMSGHSEYFRANVASLSSFDFPARRVGVLLKCASSVPEVVV
jgi:hypothetical protein